jgi:hypothetical protein
MTLQILFLLAGFVVLIKGADWLVSGASSLAGKYGIPDLVIGLTIVAFGTSAPELVVSVFAAVQNHQDIVFNWQQLFQSFCHIGHCRTYHPARGAIKHGLERNSFLPAGTHRHFSVGK